MNEPVIDRVVSADGTCVVTALSLCHKRERVKELMQVMKDNTDKVSMKCSLSGDDSCSIYDCLYDFLQFIDAELRRR